MLYRRLLFSFFIVPLISFVLCFNSTGCIAKKHISSNTPSSTSTSDSIGTQQNSPGTNPSQSGLLNSTPAQSGTVTNNQPSVQEGVITYGAYALWTGTWETTFFRYGGNTHKTTWQLQQMESNVTGTYDWDDGKINGKQSKTSGLMIGVWSESPTYQAPDDAGDIELQQSPDGNSFTGKWRYGSSGDWVGEWNGVRIR